MAEQRYSRAYLLGALRETEEVTDVLAFLTFLTSEGATCITGQNPWDDEGIRKSV